MRKLIIIILGAIYLTGCKSFDPQLLNPTSKSLESKLPAMENSVENDLSTMVIVETTNNSIGPNTQDIKTLFDRQVDEVMTNPYGLKKGYLVLKVTTIETKRFGYGLVVLSVYLACLPQLFGTPWMGAMSKVEVKLEVLDRNRTLLGAYRGSGRYKHWSGLYKNKYNQRTLQRVSYVEATKQAINEATNKLAAEVDRLNEALTK
jgi:hypothetical protein